MVPEWYNQKFDTYNSTAELTDLNQALADQGYQVTDIDGFKTIVERNQSYTNNTYIDTAPVIQELYSNRSYKEQAVNNDTVNFFKYYTHIKDWNLTKDELICIVDIPINQIINQKQRNDFKYSQFNNTWISIGDIYDNPNIFDWIILLMIDNYIYNDYQIFINDQYVKIKFKAYPLWVQNNSKISIYKITTSYKKQIKVSRRQIEEIWNYNIPVNDIDSNLYGYDKCIVYFNRISKDRNVIGIDSIGRNLEFLKVTDSLDISSISQNNKILIHSEEKEQIELSIFIPKYMYEYPILLPTDYISYNYERDLKEVVTIADDKTIHTLYDIDSNKKIYVNLTEKRNSGWNRMIRPIVLSDIIGSYETDSNSEVTEAIKELKSLTSHLLDLIEILNFRNYNSTNEFNQIINDFETTALNIYQSYNSFLNDNGITLDTEMQYIYNKQVKPVIVDMNENGESSIYLSYDTINDERGLSAQINSFIKQVYDLVNQFNSVELISKTKLKPLWEPDESIKNKIRFTHPVDVSNIWIMEYDSNSKTWFPADDINIEWKYPDIYLLSSSKDVSNKIFKAFIFYTDIMNVTHELIDYMEPSSSWIIDNEKFTYNKQGILRDIIMEKFYWVGINSIYPINNKSKWKVIERIINNPAYAHYNSLFMNTVEPFVKLGMANYLKSDNYNFPKTYSIAKMNELLQQQYNEFKNVSDFEMYLEKTFEPSYIDFIKKVTLSFKYKEEDNKIKYTFNNSYADNIQYEVFVGGKLTSNYTVSRDKGIDTVLINKSEVLSLQNKTTTIPGEESEEYIVDSIIINDPGAGYAVGQNVYAKVGNNIVSFEVAEVTGILKAISRIKLNNKIYKNFNPAASNIDLLDDPLNNIDDEFGNSYYDNIVYPGINKAATFTYPESTYTFRSRRFDNLTSGNRNDSFMIPEVYLGYNMPDNGDPTYHWYLGSRIDAPSNVVLHYHRWDGIMDLIPPTDKIIEDHLRYPGIRNSEYQLISISRFHNDSEIITADKIVNTYEDLPKNISDWTDVNEGKYVIVNSDENGKRMKYRVRGFYKNGKIIYNYPTIAEWNESTLTFNWNDLDYYCEFPSMKQLYPDAPWYTITTYREIEEGISDKRYNRVGYPKKINNTTYIDQFTSDDLAIYNMTLNRWEDLSSADWNITTNVDGFTIEYLKVGFYDYIFRIYLIKNSNNQNRNAALIKNANITINSRLVRTISEPDVTAPVSVGNNLIIRKLFPFELKKNYTLWMNKYDMVLTLPPPTRFRNELHLEDLVLYDKTNARYENVLDSSRYRVDFYNEDAHTQDIENITEVESIEIISSGKNFHQGMVWGWNEEKKIHIFGEVKTNYNSGEITEFKFLYSPNMPKENMDLQFDIYQNINQSINSKGIVLIKFVNKDITVNEDGWIYGVTDPLAPLPEQIRIHLNYTLKAKNQFELSIDKSRREWEFQFDEHLAIPILRINFHWLNQDSIYILTSEGRIPLINPGTNKPTYIVTHSDAGTVITFYNFYKRNEKIKVVSTPYPMRSVYTLKDIPAHGYINVAGVLNKPLNKKYYEFWCNGRLLTDEVSIITPTKLFLHGLTSLHNFEIIEINRNQHEFYSDAFLEKQEDYPGRACNKWNYDTYLDAVLENRLPQNYTIEEQTYLLNPIWPQVSPDNINFKHYPTNVNSERDILIRVNLEDIPSWAIKKLYDMIVINKPSIGMKMLNNDSTFEQAGLIPITEQQIVDVTNDIWASEIINNPYFNKAKIITSDKLIGAFGVGYDFEGNETNNPDFIIKSNQILTINTSYYNNSITEYEEVRDLD